MRILTLNLNGIRSAAKKGFFEWLKFWDGLLCLNPRTRHPSLSQNRKSRGCAENHGSVK